ncbi:hypothetical protein QR680_004502 [Steinernema hermaphroditum]|uniref:Uncharacterized protein n=1 Tax=Steinernema hermaphroditum TaxID=289476 RepID=A0AA39HQC3_9BILA|nr:hypothetical protein QR680_004502 [Steinernema hermaphroditum]
MDAKSRWPLELIAPIIGCIDVESLKTLSQLKSSWSDSVDDALASLSNIIVGVVYLKGAQDIEIKLDRLDFNGNRIDWIPSKRDKYVVNEVNLFVKQRDPAKRKRLFKWSFQGSFHGRQSD